MAQMLKTMLLAASLLALSSFSFADADASDAIEKDKTLKKDCVAAVIKAIGFEIKRFQLRLEAAKKGAGDPANAPLLEKRIKELSSEREKYSNMDPEKYRIPDRIKVTGSINNACRNNEMLNLTDMTRSGPFYHVAGVAGDCKVISPNRNYTMTIYNIYPRDYRFTSAYVYVEKVE